MFLRDDQYFAANSKQQSTVLEVCLGPFQIGLEVCSNPKPKHNVYLFVFMILKSAIQIGDCYNQTLQHNTTQRSTNFTLTCQGIMMVTPDNFCSLELSHYV